MPRVVTIYDLIFVHNPEFLTPDIRDLLKRVLASIGTQSDWVACISEFTRQELCEYTGISSERVAVTPLGASNWYQPVADLDQISDVRRRYNIPEGDYFLALAALQPRKNLDHLIRCFFKLLSEYPNLSVHLVLVGAPSWLYEEIFTAAEASHAFRSKVVFTGYVPDCDLSAVYSGARAFVFPSLYEGFGLPPLEAMQCGTPVIASNTTALPEVVGEAGLLVDPKDSDALCQAMLTILNDGTLHRELREKGLERARKFSWAICAEKTEELYRKASDSR